MNQVCPLIKAGAFDEEDMSAINIVITGAAGRMGQTLCRMVREDAAFKLVGVVDRPGQETVLHSCGQDCGVPCATSLEELLPKVPGALIIDFTAPEASAQNAVVAAAHGNPIVIGTTGLNEEQKKILASAATKAPIFWSPNMSVGVNALLAVLPELTRKLGLDYDIEVMEIHHNRKKDSPSGTALRLGECLAEARGWDLKETACYHREGLIGERPQKEIGLQTLRGGDVVGVHTVYFFGPGERIEVNHQAHSRETFAAGALRAAKWLVGQKPGKLYSMPDLLGV